MNADRWRRLSTLYYEAQARSEHERATFLTEVCAGDEALRHEVESLLAQAADGFLDAPVAAMATHQTSHIGTSLWTGRRFGAYQVRERLGAGGMGAVYLADDTRLTTARRPQNPPRDADKQ
jgi:hypothetical protein